MSSPRDAKRSDIWNYYEVIDEHYAFCKTCKARISYKTTTSNLRKHLQCKHPHLTYKSKVQLQAEGASKLKRPWTSYPHNTATIVAKQYSLSDDETVSVPKREKPFLYNSPMMNFLGDDSEIQVIHENDTEWNFTYSPETVIPSVTMMTDEIIDLDYEDNDETQLDNTMDDGYVEPMDSLLTPSSKRNWPIKKFGSGNFKSNENMNAIIKEKLLKGDYYIADIKGRSRVWFSFGLLLDEDGNQVPNVVACKTCKSILKTTHVGCTSNLAKHRCCKENIEQHRSSNPPAPPPQYDILIKMLTNWIIRDNRCLQIVNDPGFRKVIGYMIKKGRTINASLENYNELLPDPNAMANDLKVLYSKHLKQLKNELNLINWKGISVSMDTWTDDSLNLTFLTINVHYLQDNEIKTKLLGIYEFDKTTLTNNILEKKVSEVLKEFNENEEQKMFISTKTDMITKSFVDQHLITCINTHIDEMLDTIFSEIENLQNLNKTFSELSEILIESGFEKIVWLYTYNNEWNKFIVLFEYIEKNWVDLTSILLERDAMFRIQDLNLNFLKNVIKILKHFEDKCRKLEDERKPTLYLTYLYIESFKNVCIKEDTDTELEHDFKKRILNYLEEKVVTKITIYHKIALFLCPIGQKFLTIQEKILVKKELLKLMKCYLHILDDAEKQVEAISEEERELFEDFFEDTTYFPIDEKINNELLKYENYKCQSMEREESTLSWWEYNKQNFPLLSEFVKIIYAIPATSTTTNSVFTKLKTLLSNNDCLPKNFKEIIFLHYNMGSDFEESIQIHQTKSAHATFNPLETHSDIPSTSHETNLKMELLYPITLNEDLDNSSSPKKRHIKCKKETFS